MILLREAAYSPVRNSFHLTRFVFAVMVILTHCFTIDGTPTPLNRLTGGQINEGTIAVDGFMVVSGFLITQSALRSRNCLRFLYKRVLRIWPALTCALFFTAFIVGGLAFSGTYAEYLRIGQGGPVSYFLNWLTLNFRAEPWNISGVFTTNLSQGVNVSLWTIKHEVSLYLLMALLMLLTLHRRRPVYLALYGVFAVLHVLYAFWGVQLWHIPRVEAWVLNTWNYDHTTRTGMYFFLGATLYAYREYMPRRWYLAVTALALMAAGGFFGVLRAVYLLAMPYLVYYLACAPLGSGFGRFGDLSYGLYVYSYPVQQLIAHVWPGVPPMVNFAITLALMLPMAALSWRFIEKPALALKGR